MCTSLIYKDAAGKPYFGRTLELTIDLPYQLSYFPAGFEIASTVPGHPAFKFNAAHAIVAITMPSRMPTPEAPLSASDLKILEGLNDQGLTFSLLSYPSAGGKQKSVDMTKAVLSASDLGSWILGQFATVAEAKAALSKQPIMLEALPLLGGAQSPFHYVVHDPNGASIVIEFDRGAMTVYDNPVGVMTNGPKFDWHLTNLDNYTFLTNVDKPAATFGAYKAVQPDSGIATAGLPASNTSVGRFVRAVYYAQFTEKAASADRAIQTLAHIMNNFDRPRGVTIDYPSEGSAHLEVQGLEADKSAPYATEYTSWTSLSDLDRRLFFVRDYRSMNFSRFDLKRLADVKVPASILLEEVAATAVDATDSLRSKAGH
jgi:choloylglycine hydrolase